MPNNVLPPAGVPDKSRPPSPKLLSGADPPRARPQTLTPSQRRPEPRLPTPLSGPAVSTKFFRRPSTPQRVVPPSRLLPMEPSMLFWIEYSVPKHRKPTLPLRSLQRHFRTLLEEHPRQITLTSKHPSPAGQAPRAPVPERACASAREATGKTAIAPRPTIRRGGRQELRRSPTCRRSW